MSEFEIEIRKKGYTSADALLSEYEQRHLRMVFRMTSERAGTDDIEEIKRRMNDREVMPVGFEIFRVARV